MGLAYNPNRTFVKEKQANKNISLIAHEKRELWEDIHPEKIVGKL